MFSDIEGVYNITKDKAGNLIEEYHTFTVLSPEEIVGQSYGEVNIASTLDIDLFRKERKLVPEEGGLFCESIFGNFENYICQCGEFGYSENLFNEIKKARENHALNLAFCPTSHVDEEFYYNRFRVHGKQKCFICNSEIEPIYSRLKRWGHIKLNIPVAHIWFLESSPSNLAKLLSIHLTVLRKIVYYESYIVTSSQIDSLPVKKSFIQG